MAKGSTIGVACRVEGSAVITDKSEECVVCNCKAQLLLHLFFLRWDTEAIQRSHTDRACAASYSIVKAK